MVLLLGALSSSGLARDPDFKLPTYLPVGGQLAKNVQFWVDIYSKYDTHQAVIHDSKYPEVIYEVIDIRKAGRRKWTVLRLREKHWRDILLSLHEKGEATHTYAPEEHQVASLFRNITEPNKYFNASNRKRLRAQTGLKSRFEEAIKKSGLYLKWMERIFEQHGLPRELTRLPFVESSFNLNAYSKVGASGIWQFMPSTGKLFIEVGEDLDERNDPLRATEAAAQLLKMNYQHLKHWPLAITAYNHGRKGMMRAVRQVGSTHLEDIIDYYQGRTFGFASGNFYAEFVAAVVVDRDAEKYFGRIKREEPIEFVEMELPDYISIRDLSSFLGVNLPELQKLNPGLSRKVLRGQRLLPRGYKMRLPYGGDAEKEQVAKRFLAGYRMIPALYKSKEQRNASRPKRNRATSSTRKN